ncbi:MAG: tetratricopeptide repeat protein, partial [Planctomycetota bacterium]|nr:tetratricopeptide repeat protein [Planctomycetota bacterium]
MKYLVYCLLTLALSYPAVAQESKPLSDEITALIERAEGGDTTAQLDLAFAYFQGQGVLQDYKEAVKWYRKAADQGVADAQFSLGVAYENGQGVLQDY